MLYVAEQGDEMADPASRRRETSDYGSRYKGPVGTGELGVTEVDIRELIEQLWGDGC